MADSSVGDATRRRSGRVRQASSRGDDFADPDEEARRVRQVSIERNRARRDEQRARGEVIRENAARNRCDE